jgi:hypothetical protein
MQSFLEELKGSIDPMTDREREKVIQLAIGGLNNVAQGTFVHYVGPAHESNYHERPVTLEVLQLVKRLGSASIGEGWLARVRRTPESAEEIMFLKLKRLNVDQRMESEFVFLNRIITTNNNLSFVVRSIMRELRFELDFQREFANQVEGRRIFDTSKQDTEAAKSVSNPVVSYI